MLPRLQTGDILALVLRRKMKLPQGCIDPLGKWRRFRHGLAAQRGLRLPEHPWVAECRSAQHEHIRARARLAFDCILRRENIAVGNHGNLHGFLDSPDAVPVGDAGIEHRLRPAVDGDCRCAGLFKHHSQLRRVA